MAPAGLSELSLLGGMLAGFASSLHCVGMCGGIAASLSVSFGGDAARSRTRALLLAQTGRIAAYVVAGAVLAALGSQAYFAFDRGEAHLILRWLAAAMLVYIGLSVAGWAPSLAGVDRLGARLLTWMRAPFSGALSLASPLLAGFLWGFLPCGVVYATLFYAMLSGSVATGALIMLGFGLGTLPAVTAAAFGVSGLLSAARSPRVRIAVGLAIVAVGVASAALPWRTIAAFCGIELA
tara:strand:+ start:1789 stop:2499 length:711 start_codon:yes stop_codon:yes gene_type:complete